MGHKSGWQSCRATPLSQLIFSDFQMDAQPVGAYCAFEEIPRYWGIMTLKGKVIVDAKYEKVEIRDGGIAVVTDITGKTQTIHLKV